MLHEAHTAGVFGDLESPAVHMRIKAVKDAVTGQFQLVLV
jgi:recombinational DNA repair protein RecT